MFISREKYESMKRGYEEVIQELDEKKTAEKILYTDNDNFKQDIANLKSENEKMHSTVKHILRTIDTFNLREMNVFTFIGNIKKELSNLLDGER